MRGWITDPEADGGLRLADDLDEPEPAADEAVIEVRAFAVNRGELFLLGQRGDGWRPGQDVAGEVVTAAADGSGPPEGTRVVGIVEGSGWSERVAVPTLHLAAIEDAVSFEQAASLPIAGLTALRALRIDGAILGCRVLVTGATGGVGQFAVQLAVAGGAHVTAHVSGPEREDEARALGAQAVTWDLEDETGDAQPFDLVLDGVGGEVLRAAVHRLAPGATVAMYGTVGGPTELGLGDFRSAPQSRVVGFFHHVPQDEKGRDLGTLAALVADGRLTPRLGVTRDWEDLPAVLDAMRNRDVRGKAVLTRP